MAEMETHDKTKMTPSAAQQRADLAAIAKRLVFWINEITPDQWDEQDDRDQARILAALQATRQEALREAIEIISRAGTWTPHSVLAILECLAREGKETPLTGVSWTDSPARRRNNDLYKQ